jgi:hypothetical protein
MSSLQNPAKSGFARVIKSNLWSHENLVEGFMQLAKTRPLDVDLYFCGKMNIALKK